MTKRSGLSPEATIDSGRAIAILASRRSGVTVAQPTDAFVVTRDGGKTVRGPAGGPATIKAGTGNTGGTFAFLEVTVGPQDGPPQHVHAREDEMWFVLQGHFRFLADGQMLDAAQGSFVFVPRGTAHCFQNVGGEAATILVMFTPSGMERFFEQHAQLPAGRVDPAVYREIAANNWMEVVGPPLAQSHPDVL